MSLSRRQRRDMAKKMGYLGKNETVAQQRERIRRAQEMGKMLHLHHLQNMKNMELQAEKEKRTLEENEKLSNIQNPEVESSASPFQFLNQTTQSDSQGPEASDQKELGANG